MKKYCEGASSASLNTQWGGAGCVWQATYLTCQTATSLRRQCTGYHQEGRGREAGHTKCGVQCSKKTYNLSGSSGMMLNLLWVVKELSWTDINTHSHNCQLLIIVICYLQIVSISYNGKKLVWFSSYENILKPVDGSISWKIISNRYAVSVLV